MKISEQLEKLFIKGRLSNVAWLENAPYSAKKLYEKYPYYEMTTTQEVAKEVIRRLQDLEVEKVWVESEPVFECDVPHPAYAGIAQALSTNPSIRRQLVDGLCFGPSKVDDEDCQQFCLIQQSKLIASLKKFHQFTVAGEVEAIRADIVARRGDAYAEHKPRLAEIMKLI